MDNVKKYEYEIDDKKINLLMILIHNTDGAPIVLIKVRENNLDIGMVKLLVNWIDVLKVVDQPNWNKLLDASFELFKYRNYAEKLLRRKQPDFILDGESFEFL